ncbi:hypothetical protein [Faunimonas sp. B44]|uniref:hypothetical protein n=1 Tax=Faunimonas sp. B44 TaxID=3461493 RepID=UPI004044C518
MTQRSTASAFQHAGRHGSAAELKRCEAAAVAAEALSGDRDGDGILYLQRDHARYVRERLSQVKSLTNRVYVLDPDRGLLFTRR